MALELKGLGLLALALDIISNYSTAPNLFKAFIL